jgi:hypothetical protein
MGEKPGLHALSSSQATLGRQKHPSQMQFPCTVCVQVGGPEGFSLGSQHAPMIVVQLICGQVRP